MLRAITELKNKMKITKLILNGYRRLMLNNIKSFTYTPSSIYQLILGTNGSGKSSILRELSPLPANSKDYIEGGSKTVIIEHCGLEYELVSDFKSGNKHSFKKAGVELNPGGTLTVQKDLVESEFKLTQEIQELLTSAVNFTELSPIKRREWFTKLSDVDFTYALNVYQKLKTSSRDTQGALKHVKQRIVSETNKLKSIADIESAELEYEVLLAELDFLFKERDNGAGDYGQKREELKSKLYELQNISTTCIKTFPFMPSGYSFNSIEEVDLAIGELKTKKEVNRSLIARMGKEFDELTFILSNLDGFDVSPEELSKEVERLKVKRSELMSKLQYWKEAIIDPIETKKALYDVWEALTAIVKQIPANTNNKYNREAILSAKESLMDVKTDIEKTINRISYIENQLEHLLSLKEEVCPKCDHKWIPGKSEHQQKQLEITLKENKNKLEELRKLENEKHSLIEGGENYFTLLGSFRQCVNQYPKLRVFWDVIINQELIYKNPSEILKQINVFQNDIETQCLIFETEDELSRKEKIMESLSNNTTGSEIRKRVNELETDIEEITQASVRIDSELSILTKYYKQLGSYLELSSKLDIIVSELTELRDETVRSLRAREINLVIREDQERLATLQSSITEKQTLDGIIKDLVKSEEELGVNQEAYNLLVKSLSPTDGLIAEQLIGFITSFVKHVNDIIERIWTYDLKVLPCTMESGDLDYKFPLYVRHEGAENICPDISKGSEAQMEVVNLAFKLVIMAYLDFEDYPVFLDETGKSFDEQHRSNVMHFIKSLVDTGNYTQLFFISHYAAQFNAFTNAEVLVLDGTNISVPKKHNQHAVFG